MEPRLADAGAVEVEGDAERLAWIMVITWRAACAGDVVGTIRRNRE
jgi:hypothetical protein